MAQLQELKEPLIPDQTMTDIEKGFLRSYLLEKEKLTKKVLGSPFEKVSTDYKPPAKDDTAGTMNGYIDFYKENKHLFNGFEDKDSVPEKEDDRYSFFKQASAMHPFPKTSIIEFTLLKSDPTVFATVSGVSNLFKQKDLKLKELMCLEDYMKLTRIRVRNYIFILQMITFVDKSLYMQVKQRLLHIKQLCDCLKMTEREAGVIFRIYQSLEENEPIDDIEEIIDKEGDQDESIEESNEDSKSQDLVKDKKKPAAQEFEDYKVQNEESDDGYGDETEGEELQYRTFFQQSKISESNDHDEEYMQLLLLEEDKWIVRAQWLEGIVQTLKAQPQYTWFLAKLEQLADLDLPIQGQEVLQQQDSSVFYLHDYLDEYIRQQVKTSASSDNTYLKDEYTKDQQVYIDEQNLYPRVKFDTNEFKNTNEPFLIQKHNIREKLCLRVQRREAQTDYFITVWKNKELGNEKMYEKRLNLRNRIIDIKQIDFHPKGLFLYLRFKCAKRTQSEEENEQESEDESEQDNPEEEKEQLNNDSQDEERNYSVDREFQFVFPIQAQYKSPLMVKPDTKFLGFFGEKYFYSYEQVEVQKGKGKKDINENNINLQQEKMEDQQDNKVELQNAIRIYEYDLHNFEKIKAVDLIHPQYQNAFQDDDIIKKISLNHFGKSRDGFYYIYMKENDDYKKKDHTYMILKGDNEYQLELNDKSDKNDKNDKNYKFPNSLEEGDKVFKEQICFNEKGDKIMIVYKKGENYHFARLIQDTKDLKVLKFKQDNSDFKSIKDEYQTDDSNKQCEFKIIPTQNDFIIMVTNNKAQSKEKSDIYIFLNDIYVTKVLAKCENLSFTITDNSIDKIFEQSNSEVKIKELNSYSYNVWRLKNDEKNNWTLQTHNIEILNVQLTVCFPYMYFIYNNDQLFMKDLTCKGNQGFYYLNNFFGIDSKHRPLTIHCYNYDNSMCLNVPIIESKYTSSQFNIRVNQLCTVKEMSHPFKLTNTVLVYYAYGFNEKMISQVSEWRKMIIDQNGKLLNDVRISNKQNCLCIEKFDGDTCIQRALITHYHEGKNQNERDVTNASSLDTLAYAEVTYRLVVYQSRESVEVFSIKMEDINQENESPESIFEFINDDSNNTIFDVLIDTLNVGAIDIYIMMENAKLKRFSSLIPNLSQDSKSLDFKVHKHIYNLDSVFADSSIGAQKQTIKRMNLHQIQTGNYFIARGVFYCDQKVVELQANRLLNKFQIGMNVSDWFNKDQDNGSEISQFIGYSFNEARLVMQIKEGLEGNSWLDSISVNKKVKDTLKTGYKILIMPLINLSQIPLFYNAQFRHPVVPILDIERGFISVFTLSLRHTLNSSPSTYITPIIPNHSNCKNFRYQENYNLSPGILIRYFNGIEQMIPIKERFLKIERLTISKDGYFILLVGVRMISSAQGQIILENGMYLYSINKLDIRQISLNQSILFAIKDQPIDLQSNDEKDFQLKSSELDEFIFSEYVETYEQQQMFGAANNDNYNKKVQIITENEPQHVIQSPEEQTIGQTPTGFSDNKITHIKDLNLMFPDFDIAYVHDKISSDILELQDDSKLRNSNFESTILEKQSEDQFTQEEREYFNLIHDNLNIKVNENGHIFFINRVTNTLYFFYRDVQQVFRLFKFYQSGNMRITGADSSENSLVLWGKNDYAIYDITQLVQSDGNYNRPVAVIMNDCESMNQKNNLIALNPIQQTDSIEQYSSEIMDAYLLNNILILKMEDSDTKYLKIFDLKKQSLINYIEFDQALISGDKKFVWFPLKEQVFDIENSLSTLFIWSGGQINTHAYDSMDNFNVSQDRTIMTTQGYLQLTFNFMSAQIDDFEDLQTSVINPDESSHDFPNRYLYLFYKISDKFSILNRILDHQDLEKSRELDDQEDKGQELLQNLIEYFEENYNENSSNPSLHSLYFQSYYRLNKGKINNIFEELFEYQQPRTDSIDEILSYIVSEQGYMPQISQLVINKSFISFLKSSDTSRYFRTYLKEGIKQTTKMESIKKYPILSSDQMYKIESNISPIADDEFNKKFMDDKQVKKDVEIKYIFLGDLLVSHGDQIMKELCDEKHLDLMSIKFIKYLVMYQWNSVQRKIKNQTLYPFYSLLVLFSFYSIGLNYTDRVPDSIPEDNVFDITQILLLTVVGYFLILEIIQMISGFKRYISSPWNFTDLFSYGMCLASMILDYIDFNNKTQLRVISSIALIVLWIKLFYFLRVYESTANLIRMIIEIFNDIKNFLIVLFIGIIGFSGGFYILQQGLNGKFEKDQTAKDENEWFVGNNPLKAFFYTYRMAMGDFQLDQFEKFEEHGLQFEYYFIWCIFILGSLFLLIVLLNLLIAIMGSTYERIKEREQNLNIREKVMLISENESLFNRSDLFNKSQYLVIIEEKKTEGSLAETVDEQISDLKESLVEKVTNLEVEMKSILQDTEKELKNKFIELEDKTKKTNNLNQQHLKSTIESSDSIINDTLNAQQLQIAKIQLQLTPVGDQLKGFRVLQEQILSLQNEQSKFQHRLSKQFKSDSKKDGPAE